MGGKIKIAIALVLVVALAGTFFWWRTEWAPLQRALQVAEVLGGREADARRAGKGIAALGNLGLTLRGIDPAEYTVDRATWASSELQSSPIAFG